jgi:transposase, IS30 family
LRQYFPKGTPLSEFDQADLDAVAESLNARPRKTLDFATPEEHFERLLAGLAGEQMKSSESVRSGT